MRRYFKNVKSKRNPLNVKLKPTPIAKDKQLQWCINCMEKSVAGKFRFHYLVLFITNALRYYNIVNPVYSVKPIQLCVDCRNQKTPLLT